MRCLRPMLCVVVLLFASIAHAQVADVTNPSGVTFTASVDHTAVDSYELDILRPDGTTLQTLNLGKPIPDATQTCTAPINVQPVGFGNGYSVQVRARAGTAVSVNSLSLNKFNRVPGAPSKVTVKAPAP